MPKFSLKVFCGAEKEGGFTLVDTLISLGLVSILMVIVLSLDQIISVTNSTGAAAMQATQFRKNITDLLNNTTAWKNTLHGATNAATFACILNGTDCGSYPPPTPNLNNARYNGPCPISSNNTDQNCIFPVNSYPAGIYLGNGAPQFAASATTYYGSFDLYTAAGTFYSSNYSSSNAYYPAATNNGVTSFFGALGFNFAGQLCGPGSPGYMASGIHSTPAFSTTNPSSQCPFRYELYWVPICPSSSTGACYAPQIHVRGYLLYSPSANDHKHPGRGAFNPGDFGIDVVMPPFAN